MQQLSAADPTSAGPYRLVGRLGAGGMGVVYLGVSPTADRFAVKVITPALVSDEEFRARFAAEVETLRTVHGSRVARLERADLDADPPWLAVEFVAGRSLQAQVEAGGPLDARTGSMLGALLVDGLRSVHDAGLVHRDLKPANIMLGPSGPIVIDFGLAVVRERAAGLTATGQPVGTLAYMSPEQARGSKDLTTATDVYALGATLVYALTGHTVYARANPMALLYRIGNPDDLPDTAGVPVELAALVDAMLAFEPATRPTLAQASARLLAVATAAGVTAEQARAELAQRTYVADPIVVPPEVADPVADPGDAATGTDAHADPDPGDPTRLVPWQPGRQQPQPGPPDTPEKPKVDVAWLVEEMRTAYARKATL